MKMFKKKCDYCHEKDVFVWGKDKMGNLPPAYCSRVCEANADYEKRFDNRLERK